MCPAGKLLAIFPLGFLHEGERGDDILRIFNKVIEHFCAKTCVFTVQLLEKYINENLPYHTNIHNQNNIIMCVPYILSVPLPPPLRSRWMKRVQSCSRIRFL